LDFQGRFKRRKGGPEATKKVECKQKKEEGVPLLSIRVKNLDGREERELKGCYCGNSITIVGRTVLKRSGREKDETFFLSSPMRSIVEKGE